jgi:hypothetical protein
MSKRILFLAVLAAGLCQPASAYVVAGSMGRDPVSSEGQCLTKLEQRSGKRIDIHIAREILKRNSVTTTANATKKEIIALAIGIQRVEQLHGKAFPGVQGVHYIYTQASRVWNQHAGPIHVNRNWSIDTGMNSENIGMLIHELGHYVGNNKNPLNTASYAKYFKAVPEPCYFSWYSLQSRNEEYADVFSTFILNPNNLLKFGSRGCRKAYEFLRKEAFGKGKMTVCAPKASKPRDGLFDWK